MQIENTKIQGLKIISPKVFGDERGYFMESYNHEKWFEFLNTLFIQDNESLSSSNVLRGLHFQNPPHSQAKLVRVVRGSVWDIAVDLRKESPTYGQHVKVFLSGENKKQFFIPEGFAHGFIALEDDTVFSYKCSQYYHPHAEGILLWNDPDLAIDWGTHEPLVSERDRKGMKFSSFRSDF